jgi:hypothetical protein
LKSLNQCDSCNVILAALTGRSGSADVKANIYAKTFLEVLDHKLRRFSSTPIVRGITPLICQTEQPTTSQTHLVLILYQLLATTAIELASGATCIENIAGKILEDRKVSPSAPIPPELHQCIFKLISLLTMLYTPADDPHPSKFQLTLSNPGTRARTRYQRSSIWHHLEYEITDASIGNDFDHLLANFGNPIPPRCYPPVEARRDLYEDMLIASNLNFHTLSKIGHLKIEWVDALSLHLELHEPSSTLKLFAFPSFCAMLCVNSYSQETFLSK